MSNSELWGAWRAAILLGTTRGALSRLRVSGGFPVPSAPFLSLSQCSNPAEPATHLPQALSQLSTQGRRGRLEKLANFSEREALAPILWVANPIKPSSPAHERHPLVFLTKVTVLTQVLPNRIESSQAGASFPLFPPPAPFFDHGDSRLSGQRYCNQPSLGLSAANFCDSPKPA